MTRRELHLKQKFGITEEQYLSLLEKQDHSCAICLRHRDQFPINFAVDHSHKSGEIRGLLCTHCNYRVVGRHDNPGLLRRVADYLDNHTGWFVPPQTKRKKKSGRS